jgi:DNA-directed RNA polymerase specialized sigma24 family protein
MPRGDERFENRRHFFTAAAIAMRRIRVDDARRISRIKRGGGGDGSGATDGSGAGDRSGGGDRCATVAHEGPSIFDQDPNEVLAIGDALEKLERVDPAKAAVVNFRYFSGFTVKETASALGISPRKVNLEWRLARAWLHRELGDSTSLPES